MSADESKNPIDIGRTNRDFIIDIQEKGIPGHSVLRKFGTSNLPVIDEVDVWSESSITPIKTLATAEFTPATQSSVAGDTARMQMFGVDGNFKKIDDIITLDGINIVNGNKPFRRIFRKTMLDPSGGVVANLGKITTTLNSNIEATIEIGAGQTLMSHFTIPADTVGYMQNIQIRSDAAKVFLKTKTEFGPFIIRKAITISTAGVPNQDISRIIIKLLPKTDIKFVSENGKPTDVEYDMILVLYQPGEIK